MTTKSMPSRQGATTVVSLSETNQKLKELTTTCTRYNITYTMPKQPSFIIIGTQKGGTSAISSLLDHHPWLVASRYFEPHFFDFFNSELLHYRTRLDEPEVVCKLLREYLAINFKVKTLQQYPNLMAYEKTPSYILTPNAPKRIKTIVPWAKIIVTLRNPVDRLLSQYKMTYARKWENRTFAETIAEDINVMRHYGYWIPTPAAHNDPFNTTNLSTPRGRALRKYRTEGMLYRGMYSRQLLPWLEYYTLHKDLHVVKYEELQENPARVLTELLDFVGAPRYDFPDDVLNKSYSPGRKSWRTNVTLDVTQEGIDYLKTYYAPYNDELADMLGDEKWRWSEDRQR